VLSGEIEVLKGSSWRWLRMARTGCDAIWADSGAEETPWVVIGIAPRPIGYHRAVKRSVET
jgi:hypothetical protein